MSCGEDECIDHADALQETIDGQADEIERLKKEVANLRELVQAKDEYIACYKTGRRPSERLFAKLDRLTRLIGEPPATEGGK